MVLKHLRLVLLTLVILFVFFAPVDPMSVAQFWLLPWRNQCLGGLLRNVAPQSQLVPVYASISYVGFELLFHAMWGTNHGLFGLVISPSNGWDTVQLPPLGWENIMCS